MRWKLMFNHSFVLVFSHSILLTSHVLTRDQSAKHEEAQGMCYVCSTAQRHDCCKVHFLLQFCFSKDDVVFGFIFDNAIEKGPQ